MQKQLNKNKAAIYFFSSDLQAALKKEQVLTKSP